MHLNPDATTCSATPPPSLQKKLYAKDQVCPKCKDKQNYYSSANTIISKIYLLGGKGVQNIFVYSVINSTMFTDCLISKVILIVITICELVQQ
jgi:hypothetical protein